MGFSMDILKLRVIPELASNLNKWLRLLKTKSNQRLVAPSLFIKA